jgi:alkanesulfonate monooxygenase SsuD/methylene tetrahydromethanopterin reductase-like flavin-dependent oxidoreductase (luciferase family)
MVTDRIRLMTMVTPLPRRHPWKLARECVTVDLLSEGRLTLGVGIGWPTDPEFTRFGGETDLRKRADMLDEGLAILTGLWSGEPFGYSGRHYQLDDVTFLPRPVQRPRIPIWVAAMWPNRRPVRRAAQWDGIAPILYDPETGDFPPMTTAAVGAITQYAGENRSSTRPFDVAVSGTHHPGEKLAEWHRELEGAGATWWRDGWIPGTGIEPGDWYEDVLTGPPV